MLNKILGKRERDVSDFGQDTLLSKNRGRKLISKAAIIREPEDTGQKNTFI